MTDSINFLGSYSGIDQSMVDRLMQIEKLPLNHLNRQKNRYYSQAKCMEGCKY